MTQNLPILVYNIHFIGICIVLYCIAGVYCVVGVSGRISISQPSEHWLTKWCWGGGHDNKSTRETKSPSKFFPLKDFLTIQFMGGKQPHRKKAHLDFSLFVAAIILFRKKAQRLLPFSNKGH